MSQLDKNKIDDLFKDALDNYAPILEADLWSRIDQSVNQKRKTNYLKYAAIILLLIGFVIVNQNLNTKQLNTTQPIAKNNAITQPINSVVKENKKAIATDRRIAGVVEVKSRANRSIKAAKKSIIDIQPKSPIRTNSEIQALELLKQMDVEQADKKQKPVEEEFVKPANIVKPQIQPVSVAQIKTYKKEINSLFGVLEYLAQKVTGRERIDLIAINESPNGARKLSLNLGIVKVDQIKNNR
ncbi:MAG: hypothetical protein RI952_722 [Bacteroidota bacterium]|jgi:hypothetical protein